MRIIYDSDSDTLSLLLNEDKVSESDELKDGLIVDYDKDGKVVAFELLKASKYIRDPQSIVYQLKGKLTRPTD